MGRACAQLGAVKVGNDQLWREDLAVTHEGLRCARREGAGEAVGEAANEARRGEVKRQPAAGARGDLGATAAERPQGVVMRPQGVVMRRQGVVMRRQGVVMRRQGAGSRLQEGGVGADEVGLCRVVEQRDGIRRAQQRGGQVRDVQRRVLERHHERAQRLPRAISLCLASHPSLHLYDYYAHTTRHT